MKNKAKALLSNREQLVKVQKYIDVSDRIIEFVFLSVLAFWSLFFAFCHKGPAREIIIPILIIGFSMFVLVVLAMVWVMTIKYSKTKLKYGLIGLEFGKVSEKNKEQAGVLLADWKERYASLCVLSKQKSIFKSLITVLLALQITQELQALACGLRLHRNEYQEFCENTQKKMALITRSKKDSSKLLALYQKSCALLEAACYALD